MKTLFLIIWFMLLASVAGLAVVPNMMVISNGADKMLHLLVFCVFTIWPVMTFTRVQNASLAIAGLFLLGIGMEIAQGLVPGRSAEAMDIVFNLAGIMSGTVIGALVRETYQSLLPRSYAHLQSPYFTP